MSVAYIYPAVLRRVDQEAYLVHFPDLPEARTFGQNKEDALLRAKDCLREAMRSRVRDQEEIPAPSEPGENAYPISLSAETAAKVAVYEAFRAKGLSRVALAAKLGVAEGEVRRILDPSHNTKLGRLEEAARALGGRLEVCFVADPA